MNPKACKRCRHCGNDPFVGTGPLIGVTYVEGLVRKRPDGSAHGFTVEATNELAGTGKVIFDEREIKIVHTWLGELLKEIEGQ